MLLSLFLMTAGCTGQQNVKRVTAFVLAIPCGQAHLGNVCYEITYELMDADEMSDNDIGGTPINDDLDLQIMEGK